MGKPTIFSDALLKLIFNGTPIANVADNAATAPLSYLYVSLHTADPGIGGDQTTSEAVYTAYARVQVPRTSGGWTVTGNVVVPASPIDFPIGTGGSGLATYWAVGSAATGVGELFYSGPLTPGIMLGNLKQPRVDTGSHITES